MPGYKQTPYSIEAHFYAGNCAVVLFFITRWVFELLYTLTSPPKTWAILARIYEIYVCFTCEEGKYQALD